MGSRPGAASVQAAYAAAGTFARAPLRFRRAAGFTISARKRPVYEVSAFAATLLGRPLRHQRSALLAALGAE